MESPSFTFRLERVRPLRERAEEASRQLSHRVRGEALPSRLDVAAELAGAA